MNCLEFDDVLRRGPSRYTRAERVAHFGHYVDCPACRKKFDDLGRKALARSGGVILLEEERVERMEADMADPEAAAEVARIEARMRAKERGNR